MEAVKISEGYNQPLLKEFRKKPMPILGDDPRFTMLQDFDQYARTSGNPGPYLNLWSQAEDVSLMGGVGGHQVGIAAVTDLLDGYLARRRSQVTKLGRLLDPIADKLLVLSGLILLVQLQRVAAVVAILIIAREVAVTGVRAIAASQGIVLSAETIGKYKMVAQVVAIVLLILEDGIVPAAWNLHLVGTVVLYAALALALISGGRYLLSFWRQVALKEL